MRMYYDCPDQPARRLLASTIFLFLLAANGAVLAVALTVTPAVARHLFGSRLAGAGAADSAGEHLPRRLLLHPVPRAADSAPVGPLHRPDDHAIDGHDPAPADAGHRLQAGRARGRARRSDHDGAVCRVDAPTLSRACRPRLLTATAARGAAVRTAATAPRAGAADGCGLGPLHPEPVRDAARARPVFHRRVVCDGPQALPQCVRVRVGSVLLRDHARARCQAHLPPGRDLGRRGAGRSGDAGGRRRATNRAHHDHAAFPGGGRRHAVDRRGRRRCRACTC